MYNSADPPMNVEFLIGGQFGKEFRNTQSSKSKQCRPILSQMNAVWIVSITTDGVAEFYIFWRSTSGTQGMAMTSASEVTFTEKSRV